MWEIIFIGICILVGTHIILRLMFGETVTAKHYRKRGYEKGYRDGSTNVKMYFSIKKTLPNAHWIASQSGNHLDSRLKIDAALKEEE